MGRETRKKCHRSVSTINCQQTLGVRSYPFYDTPHPIVNQTINVFASTCHSRYFRKTDVNPRPGRAFFITSSGRVVDAPPPPWRFETKHHSASKYKPVYCSQWVLVIGSIFFPWVSIWPSHDRSKVNFRGNRRFFNLTRQYRRSYGRYRHETSSIYTASTIVLAGQSAAFWYIMLLVFWSANSFAEALDKRGYRLIWHITIWRNSLCHGTTDKLVFSPKS